MKKKPKKKVVAKSVDKTDKFESDLRLEIEYLDPETLTLWEDNPRRNDKAATKVAAVIRVHDFGAPVTIREEDGIIYKGNTRVKAARLLDMDVIPVMRRSYPDVEKAKRDALADNRMQEVAEWDEEKLAEMFQEREAVDLDQLAAETGFEKVEIKGLRDGFTGKEAPEDFPEYDENIPIEMQCPKCGYEGSGDWRKKE